MYVGGKDMNNYLSNLHNLLSTQLMLEVNRNKISVMLFASKCSFEPKVYYNNCLLPAQSKEMYLGIIMDPELSWGSHILQICKKTK